MFEGLSEMKTSVFSELNNYHKDYLGVPISILIEKTWTLLDSRQAIANEYGFENWTKVQELGNLNYDTKFEQAVDALLNGQEDTLITLLNEDPELIIKRSNYGHKATLLHYVASNGVEFWRQKAPNNLPLLTEELLRRGAVKKALMKVYGGHFSTYDLLVTSAHPTSAGLMEAMKKILH